MGLGHNYNIKEPKEIKLPNVISLSCGGFHTIAITEDNKLYSWGLNEDGQLGLGHYNDDKWPN